MNKLLIATLLASSVAAHAGAALDTDKFTTSMDAITSTMSTTQKQHFLTTLVQYAMNKKQQQDLTLSADALAAKTLSEFDGLTAEEILRSIELARGLEAQHSALMQKITNQ